MTAPKTLLELSGADLTPPRLADSCLVLIDIQNEYCAGPLALPDAEPAIAAAARLLARARASGAAIFHIAHKGRAGSLFDREAARGAIVRNVAPLASEAVIEKALPNAFAGTDLQVRLAATGRTNIVLAGFMTHMCTARPPAPRSTSACARRSQPMPAPHAIFPTAAAERSPQESSTRSPWPNCRTGLRSSHKPRR